MSRFKTLLQREWMQHHRGWWILMLAPPALLLAALMYVAAKGLPDNAMTVVVGGEQLSMHSPLSLMVGSTFFVTALVVVIVCMAVLLQSPGLARRDEQDRSIEFWLSQPVSHSASIGATVLMHLVLVPLLALGIGYLASQVVGLVIVTMTMGGDGLLALPVGGMAIGSLATIARIAFGLVLAIAWVMPMLLLAMVASAWLKRWGVPALAAGVLMLHLVASKIYGSEIVADALDALWNGAATSVFHSESLHLESSLASAQGGTAWPLSLPFLAHDAWGSVQGLAQPAFLASVLVSAACFALLVARRARGR